MQALFGGSVVYRLASHVLKQPDAAAQMERLIPKDKLPLLAAGAVTAAAIGLLGQQRRAVVSERELGRALEEMTAEACALREENSELRHEAHDDRPRGRISEVEHQHRVHHSERRKA